MKYILDTHVLLWALFEPGRISAPSRQIIENPEIEIFASALSFWEISLKYQLGKLTLLKCVPDDLPKQVGKMGIAVLPIDAGLLASSYRLPSEVHKDPFDRLLAWQAIQLKLTLITKDSAIDVYHSRGLKTLW